ncbi:MAG TPA: xanthine dehydrogenase family protein molybdopterin-binding subunit [Steroidobacteraceae bacterium]|nr:xanthine dehydrogenase family protein molybdopterin-binding subunit [Steroidobacteraceae bacterium]
MYLRNIEDSLATWPPLARLAANITRRDFLKFTTIAGSGLTLGVVIPAVAKSTGLTVLGIEGTPGDYSTPFVRIDTDNTVTVICKHVEAGQGVWTGLPAVVAEELDASWSQMRAESSPAQVPTYGNFAFGPKGNVQGTGGSTSMANSWDQLRHAGAYARAMVVQAAANRWKVPASEITVSDGVVSHSSGKKATFGELAAAAGKLPLPKDVKLKDPSQFKLIGSEKRLQRLDSHSKSTGTQTFAIDVMLPDMMTAVVLRPPRFGAKVQSIDSAAAKAVPGVVDVVQIPRGVAVVARDTWSAKKGREALKVTWDESNAEKRSTEALFKEYRQMSGGPDAVKVEKKGDADAALKTAAKVLDFEFEFPYLAHAPMEPLTAAAKLSPGKCEIWAGCQFQTIDQANAAQAAGLKPEQVTINTLAAGGTFGRRANAESDYIVEAVSIAKATGGNYPVKLIWTREDDITGGRYRPATYHHVTAGLSQDGKLVAVKQDVVNQSIMAGTPFAGMMKEGVDPTSVEGGTTEQYEVENAHVTWTQAKVGVPILWWRSVGHTHTAFVKEVVADELAAAAGKDPVAYRLSLMEKHPRSAAVLKLAAEKAGWDKPFPTGKAANGSFRGRGVAVHESFGTVVAHVVEVTVTDGSVKVDRVVTAVDCGIAVTPDVVRAQMQSCIGYGLSAALYGKISLTDGRVDQTNFHQYRVLRINEMPRSIEIHIVPSTNPPSGVGEPGTPPIGPAVANAVRAATGIKLRKLPFDLAAAKATKT